MTGINLRVATLKNAKLKNCNLRGATLAGTDLEVRETCCCFFFTLLNINRDHVQISDTNPSFILTSKGITCAQEKELLSQESLCVH